MKHLGDQDRALVENLIAAYGELEEGKVEDLDKLAELCDPYALVHDDYFYKG